MYSQKSGSERGSCGRTVGFLDWKELGDTHKSRKGAWARPNQPQVIRRTNTREDGLHKRHESSNTFVKRRGTWASPKRSPRHKIKEHTSRGRLTHKTRERMLISLALLVEIPLLTLLPFKTLELQRPLLPPPFWLRIHSYL